MQCAAPPPPPLPPPAQRLCVSKYAVNVSLSQIYSFIRYLNTFCCIGCFCEAAAFSLCGINVVTARRLSPATRPSTQRSRSVFGGERRSAMGEGLMGCGRVARPLERVRGVCARAAQERGEQEARVRAAARPAAHPALEGTVGFGMSAVARTRCPRGLWMR